jgi:hypothetical protein
MTARGKASDEMAEVGRNRSQRMTLGAAPNGDRSFPQSWQEVVS